MAMRIDVQITNRREFERAFARAPELATKHINNAMQRGAVTVQRFARMEAPRFESRLASSIRPRFSNMQAVISPNVNYAGVVHEGRQAGSPVPVQKGRGIHRWATKKGLNPYAVAKSIERKGTEGNPYMERAFEQSRSDVEREFNVALDRIVRGLAA